MATVRCFVYGAPGDDPHIVIEILFGNGRAVYKTVSSVHQAADCGAEEFYHAMNHLETPKRYYPFGDREFVETRLKVVRALADHEKRIGPAIGTLRYRAEG